MLGIALIPLASAGTLKVYPTADAYVNDYYPSSNFNGEELRVGHYNYLGSSNGRLRSYLKFDISGLVGATVNSAKLSLDPWGGPAGGNFDLQLYYSSQDSWTESGITWNTNLPLTTAIEEQLIDSGDRIYFDIYFAGLGFGD